MLTCDATGEKKDIVIKFPYVEVKEQDGEKKDDHKEIDLTPLKVDHLLAYPNGFVTIAFNKQITWPTIDERRLQGIETSDFFAVSVQNADNLDDDSLDKSI